ncbi:LamG domain-containing protein [Cytophagaceae bacterium DM2B3-1]|uniref:LamG domain-containing protein n=1 Tax=Xanthocytophaga flava TaxID=3048013 RepID=A0ABT7CLZ7_9BACT|nr:LamG domain-containing protein [Xanthocytophaga flavus]MDJ1469473.1 LamG domain-containing protein [Xanthocytophaga flavus]MDJ1494015.1 LamG domain-containing protein [Xanthocytophaga flavus]
MKKQRITYAIAALVLASTLLVTSCKDDDKKLPDIGGYNNADEVGANNLLAHWSFDGNSTEQKSGTTPTKTENATFSTGVKGQAVSLANGYLLYPTITALSSANAIPSVTVSAWIKTDVNGSTASSVFALTQATSTQPDWNQGPINMYLETGKPTSTRDTLVLHSSFRLYSGGSYSIGGDNINDYGKRGTDFQTVIGANKWVHYVMVYDGSASTIDLYANGVVVSNTNYRKRDNNGAPLGNLTISTPTQVLIGGWPNTVTGYTNSTAQIWQGLYTGQIDEVRVYSKALSATDIGSLYQLELAGR